MISCSDPLLSITSSQGLKEKYEQLIEEADNLFLKSLMTLMEGK